MPFFVRHGVAYVQDEDAAVGRGTFELEIDVVPQTADHVERYVLDGLLYRLSVFNFAGGLHGTHTFTGHWLTACEAAAMYLPCGAGGRRDLVEFETQQVIVTFID